MARSVGTRHWNDSARRQADRRREERRAARQAALGVLASFDEAAQALAVFDGSAELVLQAAMIAAGFHHPKQGSWRRRRGLEHKRIECD